MLKKKIITKFSKKLRGKTSIPSDKSISHRAVILSALAKGESYIKNILNSRDIETTINCFKLLGIKFLYESPNCYRVISNGLSNLDKNKYIFNLGNSGTTARLLMGVMAGQKCKSYFIGDESLNKRPMLRVIEPLISMGIKISNTGNINNLPLEFEGGSIKGICYNLVIPSAQVKSAIILAALFTNDEVIVKENELTRDHTENMLQIAGINLKVIKKDNKKIIKIPSGERYIKPCKWIIPSDFSSAAFLIAAALIVEDSEVEILNVNLNPLRTGLLKVLLQMGADIAIKYNNDVCGEKNGNLIVKYSKLKAVTVSQDIVASMIDEFPILFIAAAFAQGISIFQGIEELRYKESDRIASIEKVFNNIGIKSVVTKDSFTIWGEQSLKKGGITVEANLDHRIAMSCAILGLASREQIIINGAETINTSFKGFVDLMQSIGANIEYGDIN